MGANTSPLPRFRMAVERGSLLQAEAAARELGRLDLEDALQLLLLLHRERDPRYERGAVRFAGRVLAEHPQIGLELAGDLVEGLADLKGVAPDVGRGRMALVLGAAGLERAAAYVASASDVTERR